MNQPVASVHDKMQDSLKWLDAFPDLNTLEPADKALLGKSARIVESPAGTVSYHVGSPCKAFVLRLQGQSRVYKISSGGREILLYRVHAGETCVLTTTCLLGRSDYPAESIVEADVRDVVIPAEVFNQLMIDSPVFRKFVMSNYGALISDLIVLVDEVAFQHLDVRLAKLLLHLAGQDNKVARTHQQLADELGTAREVVSRQLKHFEQENWVALGRASVNLLNRTALARLQQ